MKTCTYCNATGLDRSEGRIRACAQCYGTGEQNGKFREGVFFGVMCSTPIWALVAWMMF